ncbi:hypothetical protein FQA39_LY17535 [Lamprigera yunnana]|nr:hypothetical protein FQA39_LY17535 [Lamprigera yunnana]
MQAQLRSYVLDSDKNKDVFKTNPVAMLSDVCKSKLKKKESAMSISYPTTSEDFNKIRIHSLFEDDLKSDLKYRLFKRYRSQIENNQSDFDFWNSSAKEELYKLCKIVSIDDLRTYMASSLEQSILEHSQQNTS